MNNLLVNETMKSILDRRSIRTYKDAQISEKKRDTILKAALQAPSARNAQPCQVRVVQNREMMKELNSDLVEYSLKNSGRPGPFGPDYSFYHNAPTFIFIFGDSSNAWSPVDSGIMVENMALAAHSVGLGSVIIGMCNPIFQTEVRDKWREILKVPEGYELVVSIAIGEKAIDPDPKPRDESRFMLF